MSNCKCNGYLTKNGQFGGCNLETNIGYTLKAGGGSADQIPTGAWCFVGSPKNKGNKAAIETECGLTGINDTEKAGFDEQSGYWMSIASPGGSAGEITENCAEHKSTCRCNQKGQKLSADGKLRGATCNPTADKDVEDGFSVKTTKFCNVGSTNLGSSEEKMAESLKANKKDVLNLCFGKSWQSDTPTLADADNKVFSSEFGPYVALGEKNAAGETQVLPCEKGMKTWVLILIILGSILGAALLAFIVYLMM